MDRGNKSMTQQQYEQEVMHILELAGREATYRYDAISPVRRVVMKLNPQVYGEFLFMAILTNGLRFECRTIEASRRLAWCDIPNCNCMGFVRTRSPLEVGATIED